jgi:hypothetical protein
VPVSTRPWWREFRDFLRTEIRGHGGSTAEPSPKINNRTRRPNVVEDEAETPGYVLLNAGGHANASRLCQSFQAGCDVHAVAEDVPVFDHDIALVESDPKFDAFFGSDPGITFGHGVLNLSPTPQGIDDTGKFNQQAITGRLDDAAPVFANFRVDNVRPDRR